MNLLKVKIRNDVFYDLEDPCCLFISIEKLNQSFSKRLIYYKKKIPSQKATKPAGHNQFGWQLGFHIFRICFSPPP
jgi:hypothetical protein